MLDIIAAIIKGLGYLAALGGAGIVLARATLFPIGQLPGIGSVPAVRAAGALAMLCAVVTGGLFIARLGGPSDPAAIDAVLWSPLGAALALQLGGGIVLALMPGGRLAVIGGIGLLLSFGLVGHAATRGLSTSASVFAHVSAAAWWLGGLAVLFAGARAHPAPGYTALVDRFSRQAMWIVGVLVLAAVTTAALLLEWTFDPARIYDAGLAAKAGLTAVLLGLACLNRFVLLPRLGKAEWPRRWLVRAIMVEIAIFLGIFATTAWLTSFQSPHAGAHQGAHEGRAAPRGTGPIRITDAWAPASISGLGTGAGYLTISNAQNAPDRLVGVASPWAESVTLHRSQTVGAMTRMRAVAALDLPAGGQFVLAPGGYHLMFTGLYAPFVAGDTVPVILTFERAGRIEAILTIRPFGAAAAGHRH
ncbi:copper chaperone PCu(A)C [Sphingomonas changnyeongensis]|uniref:Copper chaperone PCu(A)C n=1 Tax=Sphingomonas changnyeongensis TaxID=2698679 RepID=A0A7Z2S9U9_9SPHN|nr:copper chaperone PCu(A)C [Sphingomonas changnyeongensis]QHL91154.1 copper chaperone PCu(A)C [Sphingomonas changnyeongensis]